MDAIDGRWVRYGGPGPGGGLSVEGALRVFESHSGRGSVSAVSFVGRDGAGRVDISFANCASLVGFEFAGLTQSGLRTEGEKKKERKREIEKTGSDLL
ncbi:hypothetical protein Tco_0405638 [Tanacetum coccineum]